MKIKFIPLFLALSFALFSCKSSRKIQENTTTEISTQKEIKTIETILFVSHKPGPCQDDPKEKCLLVRQSGENDWKTVQFSADNFEYRPGYEFKIRVRMKTDYTDIHFIEELTHKNMSSREPVEMLNDVWSLVMFKNSKMRLDKDKAPQLIINLDKGEVMGRGFCASMMGVIKAENPSHIWMEVKFYDEQNCEEQMMETEGLLMSHIMRAYSFKIEGETLSIYADDGKTEILRYRRY